MDSLPNQRPKPEDAVRITERPILAKVVEPEELAGDESFLATLPNPPPMSPAWPRAKPPPANGYHPDKVYGVTRRFSLATVMLMMAGASVILAVLNAFHISPIISGGFLLLCVATALGQMFLFGGREPRKASVIVGGVLFTAIPLVAGILGGPFRNSHDFDSIAMSFVFGPIIGSLMGYVAGGSVAGVLLVMDLTETKLARWRRAREPDDDPWPPPKDAANGGQSLNSVKHN